MRLQQGQMLKKLIQAGLKTSGYCAFKLVIENSVLFNEDYYRAISGETFFSSNAITHYFVNGHLGQFDPSPYFNTQYYLSENLDVKKSKMNPLYHYLIEGEGEGRKPNPFFDPKVYLALNPDLSNLKTTLLEHYVISGMNDGRMINRLANENNANNHIEYVQWIKKNEKIRFSDIQHALTKLAFTPKISIIVPVYNPNKQLLIECIESVINQSYPHWELCLADDKSTHSHVREVLTIYNAKDKRIKTVFREVNGHISAASNSALEITTGEWTALLDHDDELHEHALFHVVSAINKKSDTEFLYSDEDKISQEGNRVDPHFKSDWNLDLLYSQNYVSHLGVYKTAILKNIGGFRLGYEGSQDFDLLLRYSREINQENIVHIPKVLYHWRMVEGSTALAPGEKLYTTDAGIKALNSHFKALDETVTVEQGNNANLYKVNWPTVNNNVSEPLVSLIIPTYNGYEITKQAIDSILEKTTYSNYEILLVDNNSNDPVALAYFDSFDLHEKVTVLRYPYPFNYSAINNFAAKQAKGEVIGLVNNDIEVISPQWLTEMVSHALREDIGCVGAKLYFPNNTIQHAGVIYGLGGVAGHSHKHFPREHPGYFYRLMLVQNLSAVTAACLLVRKSVFNKVQGLNEKDLTVAFNDVDFCLKVQAAGYRNLWTPYAELYHYESVSRGAEDNPEKVARFNRETDYMKRVWNTDSKADPCYSPNLTLDREDFSISQL
jgi:GT2 family glycosyltransferase